jgi:hypothetical protein
MVHFRPLWALVVAGGLILGTATALAGRSFKEDRRISSLPSRVGTALRGPALDQAGLGDRCQKSGALRDRGLGGLVCRMGLLFGHWHQKDLKSTKRVRDASRDAIATAKTLNALADFSPLNPPPHFARDRFDAFTQGCGALWAFADAFAAPPAGGGKSLGRTLKAERARVEKKLGRELSEEACHCTKLALGMGTDATATLEESGALQQVLTSRGCLLNLKETQNSLNPERSGPRSRFSGRAADAAQDATSGGRLMAFAKSRSLTLKRCVDKYPGPKKSAAADEKLVECACRVVGRWRFPKDAGAQASTPLDIPLGNNGVVLKTRVNAEGVLEACGPLDRLPPRGLP